MNKIIDEILKNGIPITMEYNTTTHNINYIIDGFYKSGTISLEESEGQLIATARYYEKTNINCFRDIVLLNHNWWKYSNNRNDCWKSPDTLWIKFLIEEGLVKEEINVVKTYK